MNLPYKADYDGLKTTPVAQCSEQDLSLEQQTEFLAGWKVVVLREPYQHRPLSKYNGVNTPTAGGIGAIGIFRSRQRPLPYVAQCSNCVCGLSPTLVLPLWESSTNPLASSSQPSLTN